MKLLLDGEVQVETRIDGALAGACCDQVVLDMHDVRQIALALDAGGVQAHLLRGIFEHLLTKFVPP